MPSKPNKSKKLKTCKWTTKDGWHYTPSCKKSYDWHKYYYVDFTFCPDCGKRIEG